MYGWNQASIKAVHKGWIGGDNPKATFEIGEYVVEISTVKTDVNEHGHDVYAEPPAVTYRSKHRHETNPHETLPNLEVRDSQIRIEITDLVGLVLSRLAPRDLARALWQDPGVREELMESLASTYNENGIGDAERRKFLSDIKEVLHDQALLVLVNNMAKIEWEISRQSHHYDEIRRINSVLRDRNITVDRTVWKDGQAAGTEEVLLQFDARDHAAKQPDGGIGRGELEVAGKSWQEARDFWRVEILKQFPFPPAITGTADIAIDASAVS